MKYLIRILKTLSYFFPVFTIVMIGWLLVSASARSYLFSNLVAQNAEPVIKEPDLTESTASAFLAGTLYMGSDQALRLKSVNGSLFINPDTTSETVFHYANNNNIILGYSEDGWDGKVGIGTSKPAWKLDVFDSIVPEGGEGILTPQLSHYNSARIQQSTTPEGPISLADIEGLYGVVNYSSDFPMTESYLVGIHGDISITGSGNIGPQMLAGLWGSATYGGSGTSVDMLMGVRGEITVNSGSGVRLASLYAAKPELNGGATDFAYGVFIEDMSGMGIMRAANPYALFSAGDIPSYFAGNIGIGNSNPGVGLDVAKPSGINIGTLAKNIRLFTSGMGNDITSTGAPLFINYDRAQAINFQNGNVYFDPTGKVGIGLTNPHAALDINSESGIITGNGSRSKYIALYTSGAGNDINAYGGDLFIEFDRGNAVDLLNGYVHVTAGGLVGLGTNNPQAQFDIPVGNILLGNASHLQVRNTEGVAADVLSSGSDNAVRLQSSGNSLFLNPDSTTTTTINYNNESDIILGYSENGWDGGVGIGTLTPTTALDITMDSGLKVGGEDKNIRLFTSGSGTDIESTGEALHLNFDSNEAVNVQDGNVYFAPGGNVGIGTIAPSQRLHVIGNILAEGTIRSTALTANRLLYADTAGILHSLGAGSADQVLTAQASGVPQWESLSLITAHQDLSGLTNDDHTQYMLLSGRSGGQTLTGGTSATDDLTFKVTSGNGGSGSNMRFLVGDDGANEAMTVLYDGTIGIATTSPDYGVDINKPSLRIGESGTGTAWASLIIDAGTNGGLNDTEGRLVFSKNNTPRWQLYDKNTDLSVFNYGGGDVLKISNTGNIDVSSATGSLIVSRLTTLQRDALTPVNGMIIYNTDSNQFNFYENGAWVTK